MRNALALTLLALLLAACGSSQPGAPAPSIGGTHAPSQPTEPPIPHY